MLDHYRNHIFYESVGEYKEYDEILQSSWQTFKLGWKKMEVDWVTFRNLRPLPLEAKLIGTAVKGCDISVYAVPEADINAFVIPGFYVGVDKDKEKAVSKIAQELSRKGSYSYSYYEMLLASQVESVLQMKKYSINPARRIVTFKSPKPVKISVFVTYGCLSHLSKSQRLGIYLHELGHWVDTAKKVPKMMIDHLDSERIFFMTHNIAMRYSTRYEELAADNFAKEVGYGKELASALGAFGNIDTTGFSFMVKFNNWLTRRAIKSDNEREDTGNKWVNEYPSMKKRQEYLNT